MISELGGEMFCFRCRSRLLRPEMPSQERSQPGCQPLELGSSKLNFATIIIQWVEMTVSVPYVSIGPLLVARDFPAHGLSFGSLTAASIIYTYKVGSSPPGNTFLTNPIHHHKILLTKLS